MTLLSNNRGAELRRARPLLGTLVEIRAAAPSPERARLAIEQAFAAVAAVDRLMSYHRSMSEVSRLNRVAPRSAVRVHPWTWQVLMLAADLCRTSGGLFDCTVAAPLVRWGYLPRRGACPTARERAILFRRGRRIRFAARFGVDLGGIAKGFAVDRAIDALKAAGATAGAVNAGGDFRVFGPTLQPVFVRAGEGGKHAHLGWLKEGAVATSSVASTRRRFAGHLVSPVVARASSGRYVGDRTVSVLAPTCAVADGLTKPMLIDPRRGRAALLRHRARAVFVAPSRTAA